MIPHFDVLVVGGGPAGLFAAISAAGRGASVVLFERMATPARKLLVSGSGQCNLTHAGEIDGFLGRYGSSSPKGAARFLRPSLRAFSNADLAGWLHARGVETEETDGGKIFPASRRAREVLDSLLSEAEGLFVVLRTGTRIASVRRSDSGFEVFVGSGAGASGAGNAGAGGRGAAGPGGDSGSGPAVAGGSALVLATGGASWPATGSTGDGYAIAAGFGHRIIKPSPALTGVLVEAFAPFRSCAGIALRGRSIAVFRGERKVAEGSGDVLFTHHGLSGPGVLDLSRSVRAGDLLRIPLGTPSLSSEETERRLLAELDEHGRRGLVRVLCSFGLPEGISRALLLSRGIGEEVKAAVLPREARRLLSASLAADAGHPFPVAALGGWDEAMATSGGVSLDEVDPRTMGSRLASGLFFAGELLDYDGDTGGYNIQAAFSTGRLAGASAASHG